MDEAVVTLVLTNLATLLGAGALYLRARADRERAEPTPSGQHAAIGGGSTGQHVITAQQIEEILRIVVDMQVGRSQESVERRRRDAQAARMAELGERAQLSTEHALRLATDERRELARSIEQMCRDIRERDEAMAREVRERDERVIAILASVRARLLEGEVA